MANRQIYELDAKTIATSDVIPLQDEFGAAEAKKVTVQDVFDAIPSDALKLDVIVFNAYVLSNDAAVALNAAGIQTVSGATDTNTAAIALKLDSVVEGANIAIDDTDPINPIISVTGGSAIDIFVSGGTLGGDAFLALQRSEGQSDVNIDLTALSGSTLAWGNITGTLSDQTDLQAELDTISGLTETNTTNIATVSGQTDTNTTDIATVSGQTDTNTADIATNVSGLATISGQTDTNTAGIALNVSGLATISGQTDTNTAGIALNVSGLATVSGQTDTNTSDIATNYMETTGNTFWTDLTKSFYVAALLDTTEQSIFESGGTVYFKVENIITGGTRSFRVKYNDGIITYPSTIVALTSGTDEVPLENYVKGTFAGGIVSDVGDMEINNFQTEYAPFMTSMIQSSSGVSTNGAYKLHSWVDHLYTNDDAGVRQRGHLSHLNERVRHINSHWERGSALSITETSSTRQDVIVASGYSYQLHLHANRSFTTVGDVDPLYVINEPTTPYLEITDLAQITQTSEGVAFSQNNRFSFVIWGVYSENSSESKLYVNLPSGTYTSDADAINDPNNFSNYTISNEYLGVAILLARVSYHWTTGGNFLLIDTQDLRGTVANSIAGGGSGAGSTNWGSITGTLSAQTDLQAELDDKGSLDATLNAQSTTYSIVQADNNKIIECDGTFTVTMSSGVTTGFQCVVSNVGTGVITLAAEGTLNSKSSNTKLASQWIGATVYHRGSNSFVAFGDLTA